MERNVLISGVGTAVLIAASFAALAFGCGLGAGEAFSAYAATGTLTLLLAAA